MDLKESLDRPVSAYVSTAYVKVSINDTVAAAASAMRDAHATEALVMGARGPSGIVTDRDILFKVVAGGLDPRSTKVGEVMSAPILTVDEATTVGEALLQMSKSAVRRMGVTRKGAFVGLVTQVNLAGGGLVQQVPLPALAQPGKVSCPYCGESVDGAKELSRHIDRTHLGLGLLEGNLTRW